MRRLSASILLSGIITMIAGLAVCQETKKDKKNEAAIPASRMEQPNWKKRHESFVETARKGGVDVLFLGDSITQGWEGAGKEAWKKSFEPLKAANFGISGDRTQHVLWRITEGKELDGIQPKLAVMMIGTNNVSSGSAEEIADGIKAIIKELRQARPSMKILLLGVFPRSTKPGNMLKDVENVAADQQQPKIKAINDIIAKCDDGKNVVYLDIGGKFLDKNGALPRTIMNDFLHLTPKGYAIWTEAIEAKVKDLLK